MDYYTAKKILKTQLAKSFAKTKFHNAKLRKKSLIWAVNLPKGPTHIDQIESLYHETYRGSLVKFGKPGKEAFWEEKPNEDDMTPILYQKHNKDLIRCEEQFSFVDLWKDIRSKILADREAGHVLSALLYRCGALEDHEYSKNNFKYIPNNDIMRWLDERLDSIGNTPPSELIAIYDAIMLNEDIKIYTNPERYKVKYLDPSGEKGRINTMGAIFFVCAPDDILNRFHLAELFMRGKGTPRIFSSQFDYGKMYVTPMTGGIVDFHNNQHILT